MNSLTEDLAAAIGPEHVLTDPDLMAGYTTDWTRRYRGDAVCVTRPGTTAQVADVVRVCARHRVPIVPQGGNTGLVGGSVPTGYDLAQLLAGSEGTLGVVTAARLRLWPAEPPAVTVLTGVNGIEEALALLAEIRARAPGVRAAEYFEAAGLTLVREHTGLPAPLPRAYPAYLLAEVAGPIDQVERLASLPLLGDAAVAMDLPGSAALWAYRERHTEAISAAGVPHKLDIAVPLTRLAALRGALGDVIRAAADAASGAAPLVIVFGHIGVGSLHVNVLGPEPADQAVDEAVLGLVAAYGGSISAEHGIGRAKVLILRLNRSAEEIAAMRAIKTGLDPAGLLNPGVLFT